ncbi:MAG: tetratricopeptide repeat protein [Chloroflexi bacterium]|nr:tetratricopeptide repeat protein [Chloroflexota bacterium]
MLQVKLLGQFDVRLDDKPIVIPSRASQSLLAYLVLNSHTAHRREKLAGLLWPNTSDENARRNLRQELWRIRKAVGAEFLDADDFSITLRLNSNCSLDVAELERALMIAHAAMGNIAQVAATFERCRAALRNDLSVEPSAQTRALFEQLSQSKISERFSEIERQEKSDSPNVITPPVPIHPTGTVTFLFTDIEGSTMLWEHHHAWMERAHKIQEKILRDIFARHNGYAYKMVGDMFQIAFATARNALDAAIEAQRALFSEFGNRKHALSEVEGLDVGNAASNFQPPTSNLQLRVRMALLTGVTEERADDYLGPILNRAQRLLNAAHGGQILISETTYSLLRDHLTDQIELRDMGEQKLKDLIRPEHIYQVVTPRLPSEFPPLNTLDARLINFPIQLTRFIGREREIGEVAQLFSTARLITLTGAGGSGKTRMALQVGAQILDKFKDGVFFIELAPLMIESLVPQAVARAIGIRELADQPLKEAITNYLVTRESLLIFDNCEHLVDASAELAISLLSSCSKLKILATSRERLGLTGETIWHVPQLALPDPQHLPSFDQITQYDGIQLFADRAQAVASDFHLTQENISVITKICARLDGIPLAIELASARVKVLSPDQILTGLEDRFQFLTGGSRTAVPRQQTLRAAIDWGYDLLSEPERILFSRLSVFPGDFALDAVESICFDARLEKKQILDLLTSLLDKSLVEREPNIAIARYRLLDSIREYSQMKLEELNESEQIKKKHLDFYRDLAEEAEIGLMGAQQLEWLKRLEMEHDNIRAALTWSQTNASGMEEGLRLASALWRFWDVRGYLSEGRKWLSSLLSQPNIETIDPLIKAKALNAAGRLALYQSDFVAASVLYKSSLPLWEQTGNKWGMAMALAGLGRVSFRHDDNDTAQKLFQDSVRLFRELGVSGKWGVAISLMGLGLVNSALGSHAQAMELYEESLAICRELGDKVSVAASLKYLGAVAYRLGDYARATALNEESLAISMELEDKVGIAMSVLQLGTIAFRQNQNEKAIDLYKDCLEKFRELGVKGSIILALNRLGDVGLAQGEYGKALSLFKESLSLACELDSKWDIGWCLEGLAQVALLGEQFDRAARLFAAMESLFDDSGFRVEKERRAEHDRNVSILRAKLDGKIFTNAWAEGSAMSWEDAVAYANKS